MYTKSTSLSHNLLPQKFPINEYIIFQYNIEDLDSISKLIHSWVIDDKGKNILYKKNGDERYPDFKLYKMITRLVHNHTPQKQLENPMFQKFLTSKRKLNKKTRIINIDAFEDYSK